MVIYDNGKTKVFGCLLDKEEGSSRRERELRAVGGLLREAFPDAENLKVDHHLSGAPFIEGDDRVISISHCSEAAILAVAPAGTKIGVDCESYPRRSQLEKVAARFLSPSQREGWDGFPRLLHAWCIKEALYKAALRPGLPLDEIPLPASIPGNVTLDGVEYVVLPLSAKGFPCAIFMAHSFGDVGN